MPASTLRKFLSLLSLPFALTLGNTAFAACEMDIPENNSRNDTLIVVNDNAIDSCEVGYYYAKKRNIGRRNIAHVITKPGYFTEWSEFEHLRDQLILKLQELLLLENPDLEIAQCENHALYCQASTDQIVENSAITTIVLTKGIPTRLVIPNESESPSVDNYLRHWLAQFLTADTRFDSERFHRRAIDFANGKGMRALDLALDKEFSIGRLDGLSADGAKALVDRAIEAENNGIYGKLYTFSNGANNIGNLQWCDFKSKIASTGDKFDLTCPSPGGLVYKGLTITGNYDPWRLQFGLFNELQPECSAYSDDTNYLMSATGIAPQHCKVKINEHNRIAKLAPGSTVSRLPLVDNALIYLGATDGQATSGSFSSFMNWRHNHVCTHTLCRQYDNNIERTECENASVDVFKEIDTRCAGVSPGFVGYNLQSYPVSYFGTWPTGWKGPSGNEWDNSGSGDLLWFGIPRIFHDDGVMDTTSLAFGRDEAITGSEPQCFTTLDNQQSTIGNCTDKQFVWIEQAKSTTTTRTISATSPGRFRIRLSAKGQDILSHTASNNLGINVSVNLRTANNGARIAKFPSIATLGISNGNTQWTHLDTEIVLTPEARQNPNEWQWDGSYNAIKLIVATNASAPFSGRLLIDHVSLQDLSTNEEFISNGDFDQGHESVYTGDHAANFLNRLNGTAFLGSVSHHLSGGHSFDYHTLESLVYFLRGTPLAEAFWLGEINNSGVVYGDPLYSPAAIHLKPLPDLFDRLTGTWNIQGATLNGTSSSVTTTYNVSYCLGNDFFNCENHEWIPISSGAGGQRLQTLATLDASSLPLGDIVFRLQVTSTQFSTGQTQTLNDYYPVVNWGLCETTQLPTRASNIDDIANLDGDPYVNGCDSDIDGDSTTNSNDAFPRNPNEQLDTDSDGTGNNADSDDDNDSIPDTLEAQYGTAPLNRDTDNDLLWDGVEIAMGTNPLVPNPEIRYAIFSRFLAW